MVGLCAVLRSLGKFVSEYLRDKKIDPKTVYVSSKWGYTYVADWKVALKDGVKHEVKDHSTVNFLKQLQETQELLGEYLDLYQIHSATFDSGILSDSVAHKALSDCRKNHGWAIGLSLSSPNQDEVLKEAMKIQVDGAALFDSVQCTFNVLEQKPGPALLTAHEAGLDIIIKEGLANGRALRHPAVVQYAAKLSCEPDQLALGCILAQPFQSRVLSGAVTPEQLQSNWKSLAVSEKLASDPALLQEIMQACVVESIDYWDERSALAWN
jgi:aryl-alcohol dehydrogenase-like predicted oxidoreductase